MRKLCVNLTIDKQLLDKIDNQRREQAAKSQTDISRSSYIRNLIEKALTK